MYDPLPSSRRRALRLWMLAFAGPALLAACDTDQPVAPKAAAIPTAAQPALGPGKSGNLVIKLLDVNQNVLAKPFSEFQITRTGATSWNAKDNVSPDADTTTGVLLLKSLAPGSYKVCEVAMPSGYGAVGSWCKYTDIYAGSTSGLFFVNAPAAYLKWHVSDDAWNPVGGATFSLDSTNVLIGHVGDNVSPDTDPAPGIFGVTIPFEATYKVCLVWTPPGYVLAPSQPACVAHDVKMQWGKDIGTFFVVPKYSANWSVTDGISSIGPSAFKVLRGAISIDVVDNGVNDYSKALGRLAVTLPEAGDYSVCETAPPPNHWNAQPSCKRISVTLGVPASAGTFVNPEKQVYYPGALAGR